ncbi:MAG: site-specific integrase [Candidatus Aenigmarchaeota archaeon]|nr:site-specific integrase [Candidatus Aenigmarchaeota archaeon]
MGVKVDFHNYEQGLKSTLKRIGNFKTSEQNKKTILKFCDYLFSEGLSRARVIKYISHLKKISELVKKDFEDADREGIERIFRTIETSPLADYTKKDYRVICKRFYRWLRKSDEYPPEVRWLKATLRNNSHKLPDDMLTQDEIITMVNVADHPRDKALVFCLYESGCRIGEMATLKLKNLESDEYGAVIHVSGKTGDRRVRLIASSPSLWSWVSIHPEKDNPDAFLWLGIGTKNKNKMMSYGAIAMMLKNLGEKAGIKKKIHPHLFRHSRATELANKLTEAQLKEIFGWTQRSSQAATYVHLSGRDVDNALLNVYGIKKEETEKEKSKLKPKVCIRCRMQNPATVDFCGRCGLILDEKKRERELAIKEMKETMGDFMLKQDRNYQKRFFDYVANEKLKKTGMKEAKVTISGGRNPADEEELLEKFERMKNWIEMLKAEK